ncbi:hypothetical protein H8E77_16245, partial [bacterium]|nr:hypothetical protein [bacterium]
METEVHNIEELITILKQRPQWRERLLQTLLTDEFLELPSRTNRLGTAMAQLTERVQVLAEGQRQLQIRMDDLTARIIDLTAQVSEIAGIQKEMLDDLGYLKGR